MFLTFKRPIIKAEPYQLLGKNTFGRARLKPPFTFTSTLENEARLVYVVNGRSKINAPMTQLELQTGDFILMKCDNFVNNWLENEDGTMTEIIAFHFFPEVVQYVYNDKLPTELTSTAETIQINSIERIPSTNLLVSFMKGLQMYLDAPELLTEEILKLKLRELLHILLETQSNTGAVMHIKSLFVSADYKFQEIIQANLYHNISVEHLAFMSGLSLSSFQRKFKEVYNTTPARYIKQKRVEKAAELLKNTNTRVSDIAYDCGFSDATHFSKAFASFYKISPSQYRK